MLKKRTYATFVPCCKGEVGIEHQVVAELANHSDGFAGFAIWFGEDTVSGVRVGYEVEQVRFVQVHDGVGGFVQQVNVVLEEGHALSIEVCANELNGGGLRENHGGELG